MGTIQFLVRFWVFEINIMKDTSPYSIICSGTTNHLLLCHCVDIFVFLVCSVISADGQLEQGKVRQGVKKLDFRASPGCPCPAALSNPGL